MKNHDRCNLRNVAGLRRTSSHAISSSSHILPLYPADSSGQRKVFKLGSESH